MLELDAGESKSGDKMADGQTAAKSRESTSCAVSVRFGLALCMITFMYQATRLAQFDEVDLLDDSVGPATDVSCASLAGLRGRTRSHDRWTPGRHRSGKLRSNGIAIEEVG